MLTISPLRNSDLAAVATLFNQSALALPYRWELTSQQFRELALFDDGAPRAKLNTDPEGLLVAREGEHTLGFGHCAVGRLADDPRTTTRGFIRHLALHPEAPPQAADALLAACDAFFTAHEKGLDAIHAFHIRSGYPCYLAGRGMLTSRRFEVMAALGRAGYRVSDRWLLYERNLSAHLVERQPGLGLVLQIEPDKAAWLSLYAAEGSRPAAALQLDLLPELSEAKGMPNASLRQLTVAPAYRRKGVGRWLLQRAMNELVSRGVRRLIVDINHADAFAQALLLHLGFEELPLTGYSYEKTRK